VTFLFTDIEGSTRRWEADAEAMRAALSKRDQVLHTAIESHTASYWVTQVMVWSLRSRPRGPLSTRLSRPS
jgi:hypothetical protein